MLNDQTQTRNQTFLSGPLTYFIRDTDDVLNIDTTLGPVSLYLQNIKGSGMNLTPRMISVNDTGGNASVNNITIFGGGGDIVNNGPSVVISLNGASVKCCIVNINEWLILGNINSASSGDKNFVWTQAGAQSVWEVPHNLNKRCAVQVITNASLEIEAQIKWLDNNNVEVTFSTPRTGYVYCN